MKKISTKLITIIIIILVLVNGINIFFHINHVKEEFMEIQNSINDQLFKRLQLTLPNPIWNMQYIMVRKIIQTEGLNRTIDEIIVKDEYNNIIAQYLGNNKQKLFPNTKTIDIFYEGAKIATVIVKHNRNIVEELIAKRVKTMILEAFVIIFILSLFIKFTIDTIVSKKLNILTSAIKRFKETKEVQEVKLNNYNDEMGYVIDEFNNMQQELKANWDSLNEINKTLKSKVKEEVQKNREKERQIFEQAKLVQMGEMIGNIAHQWRQPLSYISTVASSMSLQKEMGILKDEDFFNNIKNIIDKTKYLSETIDTFRNFIEKDKEIKKISLNKVISDTINIIGKSLEHENIILNIELKKEYFYNGIQGELSQVLLNLFNNSKDAFHNKDIQDKTINVSVDEKDETIEIIVADNAGGIKDDIISKIFDPYFTTKHKSQGTGIGLYICKDIIEKRHNGKLSAKNYNDGAKFTITLPKIEDN